jgi:nitroreductase
MEKSIQKAIINRTSKRSFQAQDLPDELINQINNILKNSSIGPLGNTINFDLIRKDSDENKKHKLGTYGFISGARYFVIGQTLPKKNAFLDYGYLLEKIILECTLLNLGTCWLGGTFDRGEFSKTITLKKENVLPAITPIGFPTTTRSLGDRVIRLGAGSRKRIDWEELFFWEETDVALRKESCEKDSSLILEMLRLAPSASNIQPWRIILKNNTFHFYLKRKPGYGKAFGKVDLQMIDMGIAICHFDLVAKELEKNPVWNILDKHKLIKDWEYIISASI